MIYALEHLGENVPAKMPNTFYSGMLRSTSQQISAECMPLLIGTDPTRRLTAEQIARLEKIWERRAGETSNVRKIAQTLQGGDMATLRSRLRDANPAVRKMAIQVIAQRRLSLEGDLIEQLPDVEVSSTAHDALVRLARGTDFGPMPGASKRGIARSIEKWRQWLALQNGECSEANAKAGTSSATKPIRLDLDKAVQVVLDHGSRQLQSVPPEALRLCDELVKAKDDERTKVLERLRDAKGIENTDALALAIPKLSSDAQGDVRDALAQRLTRMTAKTLHDKLQDDGVEVRRAAALACGRKKDNEHIPDLLQLLDDPEVAVIQAARTALKELTGEDFGPTEESGRRGRISAAADWRKWWKEHQDSRK